MSSAALGMFEPRTHSGSDERDGVIAPVSEVTLSMRGRLSGRMSSVASTRFARIW